MKQGLKANSKTLKIVASASIALFSLFAVVFGAYAWFTASILAQINNDTFEVVRVSGGGGIEEVNFIKFEYPKIALLINTTTPMEKTVKSLNTLLKMVFLLMNTETQQTQ